MALLAISAPSGWRALLERMTAAIAHRGPDEQGFFTGPEVGLGHARLSIVGLGDGQQPMSDTSGALTIAFNGEIFNYVELREELQAGAAASGPRATPK